MKFSADLHIHTDYNPERDRWHGDHPERIAQGIVNAGLDVYAITEHNAVTDRTFDVKDEVAKLSCDTAMEALGLFGVEMTVMFDGYRYHVVYVFKNQFHRQNLPAVPDPRANIRELEEYRIAYPGMAILAHPTLKDHCFPRGSSVTKELMESGLVDGVEVLNGSLLTNGARPSLTHAALSLFTRVRNSGTRVASIGASDAHVGIGDPHSPSVVGSVVTEFTAAAQSDIFQAVKQCHTKAVARSSHAKRKLKAALEKAPHSQSESSGRIPHVGKHIVMP